MRLRSWCAVSLFSTLYGLLTVPWIFWPLHDVGLGLTIFALYSLLAIGLAADTTEIILASWWPRRSVPHRSGKAPKEKVAIVMTVCDDADTDYLTSLKCLADAGYDVYLLDDSRMPLVIPNELLRRVTHVRRRTRMGAKAGNLNHWLWKYGLQYQYVLILDADSSIPSEAVDTLLMTAEHPQNADVAIFQSKVEPKANSRSLFAAILSAGARPRTRVIERVHTPLGLLLSFGHNQLLRLAPIRKLGGFDETLTCEDTVLSLQLAASGWRAELVDVWSHDTDPESVVAYIQRTVRWARQTVELFGRPWYDAPFRLKLLLCRHLLSYTLPLIGTLLLAISLWTGPSTPDSACRFLSRSLALAPGYELYGLTLWPVTVIFLFSFTIRLALARLEGVPWRLLFLGVVLGSAPYAMLLFPLASSMIASAIGYKVRFIPTNSQHVRSLEKNLRHLLFRLIPTAILMSILVIGALKRPGSLFVGFNIIWLGYLLLSPLSLLILAMANRMENCSTQSPRSFL